MASEANGNPRRDLVRHRYWKVEPTRTQGIFLLSANELEVLYGGAAGGGKSIALLMAALQGTEIPGYSAIILRRSISDLKLPGGLISVSHQWLGSFARWSSAESTWYFPSGARLVFGYLDTVEDKYRYQSSEFQFIGFDELTQFTADQYSYMFSRLRKPSDPNNPLSAVPLRVRSASNPGGVGHDWVKAHFVEPSRAFREGKIARPDRLYIPATFADNPHLDSESYRRSLSRLDPVTRAQMQDGNWDVTPQGRLFQRDWFTLLQPHDVPTTGISAVRYYDLAATPERRDADPDYTAGIHGVFHEATSILYVTHVLRERDSPAGIQKLIKRTAEHDGRATTIVIEKEPGSAGEHLFHALAQDLLAGYTVRSDRPTGSKLVRAQPLAAAAEQGRIRIVQGMHTDALLEELVLFPDGKHDDMVDALSGAYGWLAQKATPSLPEWDFGPTRPSPWRLGGYDDDDSGYAPTPGW